MAWNERAMRRLWRDLRGWGRCTVPRDFFLTLAAGMTQGPEWDGAAAQLLLLSVGYAGEHTAS
jgi:hypothetical protein